MRRFSQRNSLVTLSEINITPLLDLAFVLLIIFVITRPMLEGSVRMQLPESAMGDTKAIDRRDIRVVEVRSNGGYLLDGRSLSLSQVEAELVKTFRDNPKLTVDIRSDKIAEFDYVYGVVDACLRNHITRMSFRVVAPRNR
ncbi:MAG: biopolymer transporter ExbD [Verrucomicrobiota bacterium]|jgi:biopolymer transport protein ExbD/biopolymer transport protein TolR